MDDKSYLTLAVATTRGEELAHAVPQGYTLPVWMMFVAANVLENSAMEIQELSMQDKQFIRSDKMYIKVIINYADKSVRDIDRTCEYRFAYRFTNYTEECSTLLRSYMQDKPIRAGNI